VATIFVEPIQGEGGYIVPPPEFHREMNNIAKKYGILYVADEVQSGMGRTGKMFAMEHFGVDPDIIALAKGIASGMPLGALTARAEIMDWEAGSHASTFGGNPVSCMAALSTIELLEEGLMENATVQGKHLMDGLVKLQQSHECMGDVRGKGLMVAVEFVKDRETKEPARKWRNHIIKHAFQKGLLLLGCGENSIRFCPSLTVNTAEVDKCLSIFDDVVREVAS
jgi:4-aminobutyrate aminotransferase